MISWLYRPRKHFDSDPPFFLFLLEIFLIPLSIGMLLKSILLFLYLLTVIVIGVFYFNNRILILGIVTIGVIVIGGFGWLIGELLSTLLFSSNANLFGGILGAIFFGLIALGFNAGAFYLINSEQRITRYDLLKNDFIVYIIFIVGVPLIFSGLIFPYFNPIVYFTGPPQPLPDSCIGTCFIGQSATDGDTNNQKITINRVFNIKQPYYDPKYPSIDYWHNWDWILLDISLTNTGSEKPIYFGFTELTDVLGKEYTCFNGGYGSTGVELTDLQAGSLNIGETRRGNFSCVVDPRAIKPLKFEYEFDGGFIYNGKNAVFLIDKYTPLDYNSIKTSLKGNKPF
ncbi:MAG: hypothetical protein NTW33_05590 [Methanoregula sp.]|nr:hypothetical protein [Methanoregula sp.]